MNIQLRRLTHSLETYTLLSFGLRLSYITKNDLGRYAKYIDSVLVHGHLFLLLSAFILMLNLFSCHKLLFLQFLLGCLFLLRTLLFRLWNSLFLFSEDLLSVAGELMCGLIQPQTVNSSAYLGCCLHVDVQWPENLPLSPWSSVALCISKHMQQEIQHSFLATDPASIPTVWGFLDLHDSVGFSGSRE